VEVVHVRLALRLLAVTVVSLGLFTGTASAQTGSAFRMDETFVSPKPATHSDLAFWGNHAFVGYYTGDAAPSGGVRIFDISRPELPVQLRDFACDGLQADPIVWDRNGNDVADLLLLAVDRTMASPECGAPRTAHDDPRGWEGVRVFEMSDGSAEFPGSPFTNIRQVKAVYTDCGAHTITAWPDVEGKRNDRLLVYVSSYPLRPGPTCGNPEYRNRANPYDEDPGRPNNPLHGVIQVVEVPLNNPARSHELNQQPRISYPGDPDRRIEWCERGLCNPDPPPPPSLQLEEAAVACHDIVVHVEHRLAGAACAEQGQVWRVRRNGLPNTRNPISIGDDKVSSGGRGQFPGAVDFFHSVMFDNEAQTVNWVDESFGSGCPTMTTWRPRAWQPGGVHKTGRMFFSDLEGNFLSEFHVGDRRPDPRPLEYCSAHMGMAVMGIERDLLVNAWYTGGVDVLDFTDPRNLVEVAWNDPLRQSGTWSAYPYTGPMFAGPGVPVYASDGVSNNPTAQGMVVYRTLIDEPGPDERVDHLNPQTMDHEMMRRPDDGDGDDDDDNGGGGGGNGDDDTDDDNGGGGGGGGGGRDDDTDSD
jgi:hypothetical protein